MPPALAILIDRLLEGSGQATHEPYVSYLAELDLQHQP
jgi:hypothetical protein